MSVKVSDLQDFIDGKRPDAEVEIIGFRDDINLALKVWEHPETPDNSELNPELVFGR